MFGRKKRAEPAAIPQEEEPQRLPRVNEDVEIWSVPGSRSPEEVDTSAGYINMGSILLLTVRGMQTRTQVTGDGTSALHVLLVPGDSGLQVSAAMAPRSDEVWDELRSRILGGLRADKAQVREVEGCYGIEIYTDIPVRLPDGREANSRMRIIGREGDRWFSRVDILEPAAQSPEVGVQIERILDRIVIVRDSKPRARLSLLPIHVPNKQVETPRVRGARLPYHESSLRPVGTFEYRHTTAWRSSR